MNWYLFLKTSAPVWQTNTDDSFMGNVHQMYELEYKRSMLKNNPFKGMPQRQNNIMRNIEQGLWLCINNLKPALIMTFEKWLESHAITNPSSWARARVNKTEQNYNGGLIDSTISEYMNYLPYSRDNMQEDTIFNRMLEDISRRPQFFPITMKVMEQWMQDYRQQLIDDLLYSGIENFNENHNLEFTTEEEAQSWIDNLTFDSAGFSISDIISDKSDFVGMVQNLDMEQEVATEWNELLVFPLWYQKWGPEGIDETRDNVEKVYQMLRSTKTIDENIAAINAAINTAHQTGSMMDYIQDYGQVNDIGDISDTIQQQLQNLTNGDNNAVWENQMRGVGVQVPQFSTTDQH